MASVKECLDEGVAVLGVARIEFPRMEARLLLAHASGLSVTTLLGYPERMVENHAVFLDLIQRRAAREPIAHLVGYREFWSMPFKVTPDTLVPRPDTETVIEAVLKFYADKPPPGRVLDFGTGTGCLLLTLLSEFPSANGVGVDVSPNAIRVAQQNSAALGFDGAAVSYGRRATFVVSHWGDALSGKFDLIVSNPPYIPSAEIDGLEKDVSAFEPRLALSGGEDGLAAYRLLLPTLAKLLSPHGVVVLEFGDGQADAVSALVRDSGMAIVSVHADLGGWERCVVCQL
ncbi:MAG: release factor glutamine methyltransferase [Alphaproteobacteria bacterium]|jgi:release factor glutamine methyltransferase